MVTHAPHFLLFSEATGKTVTNEAPNLPPPQKYWHFVLRTPDGETRLDVSDLERDASDERLELLAVVRGLEALDQPSKVTLVTSSGSIRRGLRFGLDLWRQNRWQWERYGQMAPIKNADLWQRIDRALKFHDIECRLIRLDPPTDDLRGPTGKGQARPEKVPCRGVPRPQHRVSGARSPIAGLSRYGVLARRLLGWCGLCRSESSLVIAAH